MLCGCGLSAGARRLLGGKGLGGGPDEDREAFIFPTFMYGELTDMWFLFSRQVEHAVVMFANIIATIKSCRFKKWRHTKTNQYQTVSGHRSGPTNVGELVLSGGEQTELQRHRLQPSQQSDNGPVLMYRGTAKRGLTFLWLPFKEFESGSTPHTPLPEIPCFLNLQLQCKTASVQRYSLSRLPRFWVRRQEMFLFLRLIKIQDRAEGGSHKPKNKGPCVRSGVCWSQAPAVGMPLLRDSSCWPDIAWERRGHSVKTSLVLAQAASLSLSKKHYR